MSKELFEKYKGAPLYDNRGNYLGLVCGYYYNPNSNIIDDTHTLLVASSNGLDSDPLTDKCHVLIPAYKNWPFGYFCCSEEEISTDCKPHTINLNDLFRIYEGFSFTERGADLIGTKDNKRIIIEDAGTESITWLVHEYEGEAEDENKTFEGRVWL